MAGFLHDPLSNDTNELEEENDDPFDMFTPDLDEFSCSFADSFLDFDSIKDLINVDSPIHIMGSEEVDFCIVNGDNKVGIGEKANVFGAVNGINEVGSGQNAEVSSGINGNYEVGIGGISEKEEIFGTADRKDEVSIGGTCEKVDVFEDFDGENEVPIGGNREDPEVFYAVDSDNEVAMGEICEKLKAFGTVDTDNELATGEICGKVFGTVDGESEVGVGRTFEKLEVEKEGYKKGYKILTSSNLEQIKTGQIVKGCRKDEDLSCKIEEERKKVNVNGALALKIDERSENGNARKTDLSKGCEEAGSSETESETESALTSSYSPVSNSDEEELEEGEIRASSVDEMVEWSEDDEYSGPISSKNKLLVLPLVPQVNVTLLPHHQILPVGTVFAILGVQVVVEGEETHNPLSDGSILWITESKAPLGVVDEVFGPVKSPYYIVRYNNESDVPAQIHQGTLISFVPDFASYVLNDGNIYKKGYDASGDNDEELSVDEEFSDDEKEDEYRRVLIMKKRAMTAQEVGKKKTDEEFSDEKDEYIRVLKMKKRGMTAQEVGKKKTVEKRKFVVQSQKSKNDQAMNVKQQVDQSQHSVPLVSGSSDQAQGSGGRPELVPSLLNHQQVPDFGVCSSGVWTNNIVPCPQPQSWPTIGMPWPQPSQVQQMFDQMSFPSQQQFTQGVPPNFMLPFVLPNIAMGQGFAGPPLFGQNGNFYQPPFGVGGLLGQLGQVTVNGPQIRGDVPPFNTFLNLNQQGNPFGGGYCSFGPQAGENSNLQSSGVGPVNGPQTGDKNNSHPPGAVSGNSSGPLNSNHGNHFGGPFCNFASQGRENSNLQTPGVGSVNGQQTGDKNYSCPPGAVSGNINGPLNFNQGNHFGGPFCNFGPQAGENRNLQSPGMGPVNGRQTGSCPPSAVSGNINGPLNFNGNHFGGHFCNFGPQSRENSNLQPPAVGPVNGRQTGQENNSCPPGVVPGNINGPLNFNQGNQFGEKGSLQPPCAVPMTGKQIGDEKNFHPPSAVSGDNSSRVNFDHFGGGRRGNSNFWGGGRRGNLNFRGRGRFGCGRGRGRGRVQRQQ